MLRIGLIVYFFVLMPFIGFCSSTFGPLKPTSFNYLEIHCVYQGDSLSTEISVRNPGSQSNRKLRVSSSFGKLSYFIEGEEQPIDQNIWNSIAKLELTFTSSQHPFSAPRNLLALDTFSILQQLPIPNTKMLILDFSNYYGRVKIGLEHWSNYAIWKEKKSIMSFVVKSDQLRPEFDIQSLYDFPLYELKAPCILSNELLQFPELITISCYGVYTNFTQQLLELKQLCVIEEYGNRYDNSFETLHAERYYRTLLHEQKKTSERCFSPFDELVFLPNDELEPDFGRLKKKGELLYFENDFPQYSGNTPQNDTLLVGRIKRYKPRGIWTFKLKDQYPRNDREKHHIDFDHLPKLKFPENGFWSLNYANGNAAIEGEFENGRKNGNWYFYNENGDLRSTKRFRNDTLIFNKVQFNLHGNTLESRTYYVSEDEIYQSIFIPDENKVKLNVLYFDGYGMPYRFSEYGVVEFREMNRMYGQMYNPGTEKYERVIREGIIDKLYPEYVSQELPFTIGR